MATFISANRELFGVNNDPEMKHLLVQAAVAGLLHDIGKVKIPKNILNKKGKLDNLEYIVIQSHTAYSLSLLFDSGISKKAMKAILYHHENEDEMFMVVQGNLTIEFTDCIKEIKRGEFIIIPKGIKHKPVAEDEVHVLLFEPMSTLNTGNVSNEMTVTKPKRMDG